MKHLARANHRRGRLPRQMERGSLMLEASLALIIAALAAYGTLRESLNQRAMESANQDADALSSYARALQNYVDEFYGPLQADAPVTKNGITLAPGDAEGQSRKPSVANLEAMGYLRGFTNSVQFDDAARFTNAIQKWPAGCAGLSCNVDGFAFLDRPLYVKGTSEVNGRTIGYMMARIGGNAGTSIEGVSSNVIGAGAAWTLPNPLPGAPAGVVGVRFGFSASTLSAYVRINDNRDPNLQGKLTVAGDVKAETNFAVGGDTDLSGKLKVAGSTTVSTIDASGQIKSAAVVGASDSVSCLRAALQSSGDIVSRAADCVVRFVVRPGTGEVAVNDGAGAARVTMSGNTGSLNLKTAAGSDVIAMDGLTGRLTAQSLNAKSAGVSGSACSTEGDIVSDAAPTGTVLVCRGGLWKRPGLEEQARGGACSTNGRLAQSGTYEALICRSGTWHALNDRISSAVPREIWSGNGSATVPAPSCGPNGTPDIAAGAVHTGADYGGAPPRNRFELRVAGSGPWTVSPVLVDQSGNAYGSGFTGADYQFGWTATTYCRYTE